MVRERERERMSMYNVIRCALQWEKQREKAARKTFARLLVTKLSLFSLAFSLSPSLSLIVFKKRERERVLFYFLRVAILGASELFWRQLGRYRNKGLSTFTFCAFSFRLFFALLPCCLISLSL